MFHRMKGALTLLMSVIMLDSQRCSAADDGLPTPSGVKFVGIGYDILDGNPEGGDLATGGVDPGLHPTFRVWQFSYDDKKKSSDNKYQIPDQVEFIHRSSAFTSAQKTTFSGAASYASKLSVQVDASGAYDGVFASVSFAASARYESISKKTSSSGTVFYSTQKTSNFGKVRYLKELAGADKFKLTKNFVAGACNLPGTYDKDSYMQWLKDWGTHIVVEVDLGVRWGEIYEETRSAFVEYASKNIGASVSVEGSGGKFSGSLAVNMSSFNDRMNSETKFGSSFSKYTVGSESLNEPISIKLMTMNEIFDENYWTSLDEYITNGYCTASFDRAAVGANVLVALKGYAAYRKVTDQDRTDPVVGLRLTWPEGKYGLPKPQSGCPNTEFTWMEGYRKHDSEDSNSQNRWSTPLDLANTGGFKKDDMTFHFCMKTVETVDSTSVWHWQPGSYCIYKFRECPSGFKDSWIYYDDEDSNNKNHLSGTVPTGNFGGDTKYYFCCRDDGVVDKPIYLPRNDNFFLFPIYSVNCQKVHGMSVTEEYFYMDTEDRNNKDDETAMHPYEGVHANKHDMMIHFCYYQPTDEIPKTC